jgi:hypothetical protein
MRDSKVALARIRELFPAEAATLFIPPPHLADGATDAITFPAAFLPLLGELDAKRPHPFETPWAPLEAALCKAPYLSGGDAPCAVDFVAATYTWAARVFDILVSKREVPIFDWATRCPHVCAWLDERMQPYIACVLATDLDRALLLMGSATVHKMPKVLQLMPPRVQDLLRPPKCSCDAPKQAPQDRTPPVAPVAHVNPPTLAKQGTGRFTGERILSTASGRFGLRAPSLASMGKSRSTATLTASGPSAEAEFCI